MTRRPESPRENLSIASVRGRRYGVIYADPPWSFCTWSPKGTGRGAVSHYDCLDYEVLAALPVAELAAKDCILLLWVPDPFLRRGHDLIEAWGFKFKTVGFYWVKLNKAAKHDADFFVGLGHWTRANPEQCLLATRGHPSRKATDVRRLVVERRRQHSRKPDCVRERIERLVDGPYLELFARETKPGWDSWGDQVGLFDHGAVPTRRQPYRLTDAVGRPLGGQERHGVDGGKVPGATPMVTDGGRAERVTAGLGVPLRTRPRPVDAPAMSARLDDKLGTLE
jgi:N6-adenosine-specific RNA methylase IME4